MELDTTREAPFDRTPDSFWAFYGAWRFNTEFTKVPKNLELFAVSRNPALYACISVRNIWSIQSANVEKDPTWELLRFLVGLKILSRV
jgi:hypothetical protein